MAECNPCLQGTCDEISLNSNKVTLDNIQVNDLTATGQGNNN